MKRCFVLTLALALLVGLIPAGTQPPAAAQEAVEITFVHIFPDERDVRRASIEEIAAAFMAQNPNVTINIQSTTDSYQEVFENALLAAGQGDPPHVIQVEDTLTQIAIDSQMFVKISDYASDEQLASVPDIISPLRNYYGLDEAIWGMPWNASNPVLFYNPDMLAAAGLDPDHPPATFDELMSACEAIMAAKIEGLEACVNWPLTSWLVEQWLSQMGALFVNNDNGHSERATEVLFTSPEMLSILSWWKDMADRGYYTWSGTPQAYTPEGLMFVTKKTALHITTTAALSNILAFAPTMGKFTPRVARFPRPNADANNGITPGGAALWVMAGHSEAETQAAVDWVFFLTNTENIQTWHKASGYLPIRQSSIEALEAEGWYEEHPEYRIALDQLLEAEPNAANAGTRIGAYQQVREALMNSIQAIIDGGEDPAASLQAAKERADQAIQEYNEVIGG